MPASRLDLCVDLQDIAVGPVPEGGCRPCLDMGDAWVHLRFCLTCEAVGCCDDSKNRHARKHAAAHAHPVIRSKEPGEFWAYCYEHDMGRALPPPQ